MSELWSCPVDGCDWWVSLSGYTGRAIGQMKTHVMRSHRALPVTLTRVNGGIVDAWLAAAIAAALDA